MILMENLVNYVLMENECNCSSCPKEAVTCLALSNSSRFSD